MNEYVSTVWSRKPADAIYEKLKRILDQAAQEMGRINVFFRADDIALADDRFCRLMHLFQKHRIPLCLAVVPQWLNVEQWRDMEQFAPREPLWCWHQHGWNHTNHESSGKKSEFGATRSREDILKDLQNGRNHLETILDGIFYPVFTPPWNRCSSMTLELLEELDFLAVSRSLNAKPPYAGKLPDLAVNVDLHTRRETDRHEGWNNLLAEFTEAARSGRIGIMLHHQRMNDTAFEFLSFLLPLFGKHRNFVCSTFREFL